ncbi:MAG: hypothetical protein RIS94_1767 [Pseudomonadota bacterium]
MTSIPIIVLAGQSNAAMAGVDNRLFELASAQGPAFELVKVAVGGTSLFAKNGLDWDPASSGELYDALVKAVLDAEARVVASGNRPVVVTLWIQGESDASEPNASRYDTQLATFIADYRAVIGQSQSLFAVSLLMDSGTVRNAQLAVVAAGDHLISIDTVGGARWDQFHYDKPTREGIANAFFARAGVSVPEIAYDNHLGPTYVGSDDTRVIFHGPPYADVSWVHPETTKDAGIVTQSGDDIVVTGSGNDTITTNGNDDRVLSGAGNDRIDLGQHNDFADAGPGDDIVLGWEGNDTILGGPGNDIIGGGSQDDVLIGGLGDDRLDGGSGADRMTGGNGDDTFVVDNPGDAVIERTLGGNDTVYTSVSFTVPAHVETLVQTGTAAIDATGTSGNNTIVGNAGANRLSGGRGDDVLSGMDGNDRLLGGVGADRMNGGAGDDTFVVDNPLDQVIEIAGGGRDTVMATVSRTMPLNVEVLKLAGTADLWARGTVADETMVGNSGANVLYGGGGVDTVTGGQGADTFSLTRRANGVMHITDFTSGQDRIQLPYALFPALAGSASGLAPGLLGEGTSATSAAQRVIYDAASGALWYDPDGTGDHAQVLVAMIENHAALAPTDFLI